MNKLSLYNAKYNYYISKLNINELIGGSTKFTLKTDAFKDGHKFKKKYTSFGKNIHPYVKWHGIPKNTKDLLLLMYDLDADNFIHWLLYNINPKVRSLEGKYVIGKNTLGDNKYSGPEPPEDSPEHNYVLALYALNDKIILDANRSYTLKELKRIIKPLKIEKTKIVGTYKNWNT